MRAALLVLVAGLAVLGGLMFLLLEREGGSAPPGAVSEITGQLVADETSSDRTDPAPGESAQHAPLRILLLEPDMATPAAGRTLQVYSYVPRSMSLPEYVQSVRTGPGGIADCDGLPGGSYVVCAPGASPRSAAPRTARATVEAGRSALVRVVEAPAATRVRFDVRASFAPRFGVTSKLVLRRVDDGSGEPYAQPDLLKPGAMAFDLDLPPGRYAVGTSPLGELLVDPGSREIVVGGDPQTVTVVLSENPARIDVVLEGLPPVELPARVYPQAAGTLLDDRPEQVWWGPHRWHRPDLQVPVIDGPRRVLVFGQGATFRSRELVTLDGDQVTVSLEQACRLVVDWFAWDPARDAGAVLAVEVGEEVIARTLVPRFGQGHPELDRPAMGGEVVVTRGGEARLECRRVDGSLAWARTVALGAEPVRIRVE